MSDRLTIHVTDGVADIRLNRPEKLNALDHSMFEALVEASEEMKSRPDVRVVVLSGEGRSFCAGLDFSAFQTMADDNRRTSSDLKPNAGAEVGEILDVSGRITHLGQQAVWGWKEVQVPVICALNGHALGGGFQLALGGDIRIVHPDTKMSVLEIRWGLVPDMCASELLPRLVGSDVAAELYYTGRMLSGVEAVELGVCTRLSDDPVSSALGLARDIASKNPHAIRHAKSLIGQFGTVGHAEAFANERRYLRDLVATPNQIEAVSAFFEKRDASYADPI